MGISAWTKVWCRLEQLLLGIPHLPNMYNHTDWYVCLVPVVAAGTAIPFLDFTVLSSRNSFHAPRAPCSAEQCAGDNEESPSEVT